MQQKERSTTMSDNTSPEAWPLPELTRARRAIVVVDVVESVRLMQAFEADVIDRWRRFVNEVVNQVLPVRGGRLVKSLGDGLLLEFENVPSAVAAALEIQGRIPAYNTGHPEAAAMHLRIGLHVADVVVDELDVYGAGVNLAARLVGLAGPGDIVVSSDVREHLLPGLDADIEDLGDCHLRHVNEPVRASRLRTPSSRSALLIGSAASGAQDAIRVAVLPFCPRSADKALEPLCRVLADDVIAKLSLQSAFAVISRQSSGRFEGRVEAAAVVGGVLGANYLVQGSVAQRGGRLRLFVQVVDAGTDTVVWADRFDSEEAAVMADEDAGVAAAVEGVCKVLVACEVRRAATLPLPTLSSYTILIGAISRLHSLSAKEFERAREMLSYLIDRHPKQAAPKAWLALWHVMRVGQGWSKDAGADATQARALVSAALDIDASNSLSLAVDGLTCAYVNKDFVTAAQRYDAALKANPNESLAWLYRSALLAYHEQGKEAVDAALHAQSLSPIDPIKYYYDNFTSTAMLSAGNLRGTIDYGLRSLRANRMHGPTIRVLAIAYSLAGEMDAARDCVQQMLALEPGFTVSRFRDRYPGRAPAQVDRYARALAAAGLAP
jgi:adenylate cyclase